MSVDPKLPLDEIFKILIKWTKEESIFIEETDLPDTLRSMKIRIGKDMIGYLVVTNQSPNKLIIGHKIVFSKDIQNEITNLSDRAFIEFWYDLFSKLVILGVEFNADKNKKEVKSIQINYEFIGQDIKNTTITKTWLLERIAVVRKSVLYAIHCTLYHIDHYGQFLGLD